MTEVANEFNSFFVNVGPNLAKTIKEHKTEDEGEGRGGSKMVQSMFVDKVSEEEIVLIVTKLKSKTSIDSDGLDMEIVKRTIDCIIKPLCYIFNLSFQTGTFPNKMKVAKVIPLFKNWR